MSKEKSQPQSGGISQSNSDTMGSGMQANTARLRPKIQKYVGWVEERNPTFSVVCWVSQNLNPTYKNP
jgi:hypothetical protein